MPATPEWVFVCTELAPPPQSGPALCNTGEWVEHTANPLWLDIDAANELSVAILGIWAIAFVFKTLARQLLTL